MKNINQIQRAHDLLEPVVTGEMRVSGDFPFAGPQLNDICRVLCWVLDDVNAACFDDFLRKFEQAMRDEGYTMPEKPQLPFPMRRIPGVG